MLDDSRETHVLLCLEVLIFAYVLFLCSHTAIWLLKYSLEITVYLISYIHISRCIIKDDVNLWQQLLK